MTERKQGAVSNDLAEVGERVGNRQDCVLYMYMCMQCGQASMSRERLGINVRRGLLGMTILSTMYVSLF